MRSFDALSACRSATRNLTVSGVDNRRAKDGRREAGTERRRGDCRRRSDQGAHRAVEAPLTTKHLPSPGREPAMHAVPAMFERFECRACRELGPGYRKSQTVPCDWIHETCGIA